MQQRTCDRCVGFHRLVPRLGTIGAHVRHASNVLLTLPIIGDVTALVVCRASYPHSGEIPFELFPRLVSPADLAPQRIDQQSI